MGIPIYNIHHSKEIYGDPEVFRSERWDEELPKRHVYSFIPFGGGSRLCLGKNFSLMEQQVFLGMLLQRFELNMEGKPEVEIGKRSFLLNPKPKEIVFTLRK